ncbi:MAG: putative Ig domain-containing protein [Candidatus Tritonobacter lacicola]|nr:putative Ig domain-containing protein [Candidatus Tritonobacter lacicola]
MNCYGWLVTAVIICRFIAPAAHAADEGIDGVLSSVEEQAPLVITTAELPGGMVGVEYERGLSAEGGSPPYAWSITGKPPPGLYLDEDGPAVRGTPEVEGEFIFSVMVTGGGGATDKRDYSIRVMSVTMPSPDKRELPPPPLVLQEADLPEGKLGRNYSAFLIAEGGTPPYFWLISGGSLPRGLSLNAERESKTQDLDNGFRANSGNMVYVTQKCKGGKYHRMDCSHLKDRGIAISLSDAIEGGYVPCLKCKPDGYYEHVHEAGEATIKDIPEMPGDYDFTVTVRDEKGGTAAADYSISIGTVKVYITTGYLPDAVIGEEYDYQLDAVGGVTPYWWRIEAGSLPRGLSLDADEGFISGVPKESSTTWAEGIRKDIEAGLFRVLVMDGVGSMDRAEFRINVVEKPEQSAAGERTPSPTPILLGGGVAPLKQKVEKEEEEEEEEKVVVVTEELPYARIDGEYTATLEAAGGSPPYTWSIHGSIPEGLSLAAEGIIQGVPTEADMFAIKVQASDSLQKVSEIKEISLEVKDALKPITGMLAAASDGKVGLAWVNPAYGDFEEVKIVRNSSGEPADSDDGEIAYQGNGDNTVDTGLENGTRYYYAAFALDAEGNESGTEESSYASAEPMDVTLTGERDPFADEVISFEPLTPVPAPFGFGYLPKNVLGPPFYDFSQIQPGDEWKLETYVVSLHAKENNDNGATPPYGGTITLRFSDNIVVNEEGVDFSVFSTSFLLSIQKKCPECGEWVHIDKEKCRHCKFSFKDATGEIEELKKNWMEPAVVEVSQDGENFYRFPIDYVVHYDGSGNTNLCNPYSYNCGFAGIWPAKSYAVADTVDPARSGGDQFDLDSITTKPLSWIQYIRLIATGDKWIVDMNGDLVRHPSDFYALSGGAGEGEEAGEARKSGFDLDAIAAIHY